MIGLGLAPLGAGLAPWLLSRLAEKALPVARTLLEDPLGTLGRVGDVLVWLGSGGTRVDPAPYAAASHSAQMSARNVSPRGASSVSRAPGADPYQPTAEAETRAGASAPSARTARASARVGVIRDHSSVLL